MEPSITTESTSSTTRSEIARVAAELTGVAEVWLFGSVLDSPTPSDIDLLVVYRSDMIKPADAVALRGVFDHTLNEKTGLRSHIVLFNVEEAEETQFAELEGAELVYPKA